MALVQCVHASVYGGAWSLRLESDVKISVSWIGVIKTDDLHSSHGIFIEPMIGLSGSGIYCGYEYSNTLGSPRNHSKLLLRPKIGILTAYNDPWIIANNQTYGYLGIECARVNYFLGLNGQIGFLVNNDHIAPSIGIGFGF